MAARPLRRARDAGRTLAASLPLPAALAEIIAFPDAPLLTAHDVQFCLCEFDKYERVRLGEGRPRALYKPPATPAAREEELII